MTRSLPRNPGAWFRPQRAARQTVPRPGIQRAESTHPAQIACWSSAGSGDLQASLFEGKV